MSFADLFCGAGGLSAGFLAAGYELAFALDKDADSCDTFERNLGLAPECASISDFTSRALAHRMKGVDVIVGGPSCQTFSTQGRRYKWADPDDERTKLWRTMLGVVAGVRPRAFLLENVPGLSHKGLVYERNGQVEGELASEFRKLGYAMSATILLAANYGVPQLRRRLFVVGVLDELQFQFPAPTHFGGWRRDSIAKWEQKRIERGLLRHLTVGDALGDLPAIQEPGQGARPYGRDARSGYEKLMRGRRRTVTEHETAALGDNHARLIRHVPPGGTWRDIPPHLLPQRFQGGMRRSDSTTLLGRLHSDRPAYTITTQFTNVTAGCFTHPTEDRSLSIREGARLQSFPDGYLFTGFADSKCRQIGNAVPPLLAQHLACAVAETLKPDAEPRRPRVVKSVLEDTKPDELTTARMKRQRRKDTGPEVLILDALSKRGIEFKRHVKPLEGIRREADGCLEAEGIALFIDGCFWHGCPVHTRPTKSNTLWWREKIDRNRARDAETDALLRAAGWRVVRVWEHENPEAAVTRIERVVTSRRNAKVRPRRRRAG